MNDAGLLVEMLPYSKKVIQVDKKIGLVIVPCEPRHCRPILLRQVLFVRFV